MNHRQFFTEAFWGVTKAFAGIPQADNEQWAVVKAVHELHDWNFTMNVEPYIDLAYGWKKMGIEYQREAS